MSIIYKGKTIATGDTSFTISDVVTQVENGVKDIEDKRVESLGSLNTKINDGLAALGNASDALRQTQITNCLLEVPQNIKLELSNGVLTLKADSKVIRPNGVNVFDEITFSNDISLNVGGVAGDNFIVYRQSAKILAGVLISNCYSGDSAPSGNAYQIWYNTAENKIYTDWNRTGDWIDTDRVSLPLCIYTSDGTTITALKQVFNGIGYIGSHLFVNKGLKGLIPNGFNSDGTLNNIEFTVQNVTVSSRNLNSNDIPVWYRENGNVEFSTGLVYNDEVNKVIGSNYNYLQIATVDMVNGVISNLRVGKPFRAVDYNDYKQDLGDKVSKAGDTMTGNLYLQGPYRDVTIKSTVLDYTIAPSGQNISTFRNVDKNDKILGDIRFERYTDGRQITRLLVRNKISGTEVTSSIGVGVSEVGAVWTFAQTPATGDNSTQIATTAFVNNQIDYKIKSYITDTYNNGDSWYRIWSDGWCEQGGVTTPDANGHSAISLLKAYANTNYNVVFGIQTESTGGRDSAYCPFVRINTKTVSGFDIYNFGRNITTTVECTWKACGYID